MTFDLAQMIADREAGTPGLWLDELDDDTMDIRIHSKDSLICVAGNVWAKENRPDAVEADARRIARVPLLEAEIIRLTARVERLEGALNGMLQSVCGPTGFAEAVRHNSGHAYSWHSLDDAEAKARAALSTHTEEPK